MSRPLVDRHGAHITSAPTVPIALKGEGFEHRRVPDPAWREQLAQLSPRSEQVPYLWLDWIAGVPERPVQRWGLWEVIPAPMLDRLIFADRTRGIPEDEIILASIVRDLNEKASPEDPSRCTWVRDRTVPGGKRLSSDSLVNQYQWDMWRELKGFVTLFWIIEGQRGGHKRSFSQSEETRLRRLRLPPVPPIPGMLTYAPFDRRVTNQLARFDRIMSWEGDFTKRTQNHQSAVDVLDKQREQAASQAESEADLWISEQIQAALDEIPDARVHNIVSHIPTADDPGRKILIRGGVK